MSERSTHGYASVIVLLSAVSHYPNSHKRAPPSTGFSGKWSPEGNCTLRRLGEWEKQCVCVCVRDPEWERNNKRQKEGGKKRERQKEHV